MLDVLVIGAGLGGLSAALRAARAGLSVRVITKGMGSHHWTPGTIDVLGYLPGEEAAVERPFEAMARLPEEHPYRLLGSERVREALTSFCELANLDELGYAGACDDVNTMLPSPAGALRPVWRAPSAQLRGFEAATHGAVIVGVDGLRDFYPHLIAENLNRQGWQARAASVPWSAISECADRNAIQLAEGLDHATHSGRLEAALRSVVRAGEWVGLPAVLGTVRHMGVLVELELALHARIFEIPLLPPSVPGVRLYWRLRDALRERGVRIEAHMEVSGFGVEEGAIAWVESATSARPLRHHARAYVLSSGGILGGGFGSDPSGRVWDAVFGLPLTVPQQRNAWFTPDFLGGAGQPVFRGGVRVDARLQPLDEAGNPVYANLWAAGACLAGADPIRERSLEGIAIATGIAAAEGVSRMTGDR